MSTSHVEQALHFPHLHFAIRSGSNRCRNDTATAGQTMHLRPLQRSVVSQAVWQPLSVAYARLRPLVMSEPATSDTGPLRGQCGRLK